MLALWVCPAAEAQASSQTQSSIVRQEFPPADAESELQTAIGLTRHGQFAEAIPRFLAVRGKVKEDYAENFNLALCYVGTHQFKDAISILTALRQTGDNAADVNNLLAQAYIGDSQSDAAFAAFHKAAELTPLNEKLYVFVADACTDHQNYALGLKVIDLGLEHLPQSARLHYERAMFLSSLDQFDLARKDFDAVDQLAPETAIAYLARAQKFLYEGKVPEAVLAAREGVKNGDQDFRLLTILGEALIRSGVSPGQQEFAEARWSLEKAVEQRPNSSGAHIALGKLDLLENRLESAIAHLSRARQLDPENPSVYAILARAYQRADNQEQAQAMLSILAKLNRSQAEKISSAPGDRKVSDGRSIP